MKKLKLNPDALAVASFETAEAFTERGTVEANIRVSYWYSRCTACLPEPSTDCTVAQ